MSADSLEQTIRDAYQRGFQGGLEHARQVESQRFTPEAIYARTGSYPSRERMQAAAAVREMAEGIEEGHIHAMVCAVASGKHSGGAYWTDDHESVQALLTRVTDLSGEVSNSALWQRNGRRFMRKPTTKQ